MKRVKVIKEDLSEVVSPKSKGNRVGTVFESLSKSWTSECENFDWGDISAK